MKKFLLLVLLTSAISINSSSGQTVVSDTANIRKPAFGKLYFSKKDSGIYLYKGVWAKVQVNALKQVVVPPPVVVPPVVVPPSIAEIVVGYWDIPGRVLVLRNIDTKYYLMQTDAERSYYVARGSNLLKDKRTVIAKPIVAGELKSGESALGGLFEPVDFPKDKFIRSGFAINANGEYVKVVDSPIVVVPPIVVDTPNITGSLVAKIIAPKPIVSPNQNDSNWEQFADVKVPPGIYNILGQGSPLFNNEPLGADGTLLAFKKGVTNIGNLHGLHSSTWKAENSYFMTMANHCIIEGAKIVSKYYQGADKWVIDDIIKTRVIDYTHLSVEGAIELGKRCYSAAGWINAADHPNDWRIPNNGVLQLDQEPAGAPAIPELTWAGGNQMDFFGYITRGINAEAPKGFRLNWYGNIWSWFGMANGVDGENYTLQEVKHEINNGGFGYSGLAWEGTEFFADLSFNGYLKVPYIDNRYEIYDKNPDGSYKMLDGRRVYRSEDFVVDHFGKKETILKDMAPERRIAETWWRPESKMFVDGIYNKADAIMFALLKFNYEEFKNYDISRWKSTAKRIPYMESSLQTEPWTANGNAIVQREIGLHGIRFETLMPILSGVRLISTWGDGGPTLVPSKGSPIWGKNEDYTRHMARTGVFNEVAKELERTDPSTYRYLHFYYPFVGNANKGIIASATVAGNKTIMMLVNPSCGKDEYTTAVLTLGNQSTTLKVGRDVQLMVFETSTPVDPNTAFLAYNNIFGKEILAKGIVTNVPEDCWLKGL